MAPWPELAAGFLIVERVVASQDVCLLLRVLFFGFLCREAQTKTSILMGPMAKRHTGVSLCPELGPSN